METTQQSRRSRKTGNFTPDVTEQPTWQTIRRARLRNVTERPGWFGNRSKQQWSRAIADKLGTDAWHITIASRGRGPLATEEGARRAVVRKLVEVAASVLGLFHLVDDHLHLVFLCPRGIASQMAGAVQRSISRLRSQCLRCFTGSLGNSSAVTRARASAAFVGREAKLSTAEIAWGLSVARGSVSRLIARSSPADRDHEATRLRLGLEQAVGS